MATSQPKLKLDILILLVYMVPQRYLMGSQGNLLDTSGVPQG